MNRFDPSDYDSRMTLLTENTTPRQRHELLEMINENLPVKHGHTWVEVKEI